MPKLNIYLIICVFIFGFACQQKQVAKNPYSSYQPGSYPTYSHLSKENIQDAIIKDFIPSKLDKENIDSLDNPTEKKIRPTSPSHPSSELECTQGNCSVMYFDAPSGPPGAPGSEGPAGPQGLSPHVNTDIIAAQSYIPFWHATVVNTASIAYVQGPDNPPLGIGSLRMMTGAHFGTGTIENAMIPVKDGFGYFGNWRFNGIALKNLTALSYSFYVKQPAQAYTHITPYITMYVDGDGDGGFHPQQSADKMADDILIYYPFLNGYSYVKDLTQWRHFDALEGSWLCVYNRLSSCNKPFMTIKNVLAAHPNAQIAPSPASPKTLSKAKAAGLLFTVGPTKFEQFSNNLEAYIDNIIIGIQDKNMVFDLEP